MALFEACKNGDVVALAKILSETPDVFNELDFNGYTWFHTVCVLNNVDTVKFFLNNIVKDINEPNNKHSISPFHYACGHEAIEVVEYLLELKKTTHPELDINHVDDRGQTPFFVACFSGNSDMANLLLLNPDIDVDTKAMDMSPIDVSIYMNNNANVLKILLANERIDIRPNLLGNTPFHLACRHGRTYMLEPLLADTRIDPYVKNTEGKTAFDLADENGQIAVVEFLNKIGICNQDKRSGSEIFRESFRKLIKI